jgi:hypothetical protein
MPESKVDNWSLSDVRLSLKGTLFLLGNIAVELERVKNTVDFLVSWIENQTEKEKVNEEPNRNRIRAFHSDYGDAR